jgi:phosphate acetyltransferase
MKWLENRTFDELQIGDQARFSRLITDLDIQRFAELSGDFNPLHLDDDYAKTTPFQGRIAHGMFVALLLTSAIATEFPGPGSLYRGQEMKFERPVRPGDLIEGVLTVIEKKARGNLILIECQMFNQSGERVFSGVSRVIAPTQRVRVPIADQAAQIACP